MKQNQIRVLPSSKPFGLVMVHNHFSYCCWNHSNNKKRENLGKLLLKITLQINQRIYIGQKLLSAYYSSITHTCHFEKDQHIITNLKLERISIRRKSFLEKNGSFKTSTCDTLDMTPSTRTEETRC